MPIFPIPQDQDPDLKATLSQKAKIAHLKGLKRDIKNLEGFLDTLNSLDK